ncbi:MAG: NAD(P)/FAD-dependent oxidoreductase [Candidatus Sungbacteria bacterium]|nr:NAD(P)/FAD-dependent oxidoreductase [Candidatus Sungbacteria bacterium]
MDKGENKAVVIIGAGPAGLTAAYELAKRGTRSIILEKDSVVGGIARTVLYKGYRFDIGGHRFFTKVECVFKMWQEVLGADFLKRPRLSRIYYKGKFFFYPLKALDVVRKLGLKETFLSGLSYVWARVKKRPREDSFEDYIINHFGTRLYRTFFKSYTEKVWGIPCTEIKAEWAAQRIKGLSLTSLLKATLFGNRRNKIKTLIEEFYYPRLGPGMMWQKTKDLAEHSGYGKVLFKTVPVAIHHDSSRITAVTIRGDNGKEETIETDAVISSMPLSELFRLFRPELDGKILKAAASLHYRDFITVALVLDKEHLFGDNWIYVHEPGVLLGRIQNFKNWSPSMVPDASKTCLGLEYFCFTSDPIWKMTDEVLVNLGAAELEKIGLAQKSDVVDGAVVRMEKTYPVYDDAYEKAMPLIKDAAAKFPNLYPVGRNGMHKYNNQDHAMYTAMLAVENIFGARHNLWDVNVERVYHEEVQRT